MAKKKFICTRKCFYLNALIDEGVVIVAEESEMKGTKCFIAESDNALKQAKEAEEAVAKAEAELKEAEANAASAKEAAKKAKETATKVVAENGETAK